jgi:hypothetical protein
MAAVHFWIGEKPSMSFEPPQMLYKHIEREARTTKCLLLKQSAEQLACREVAQSGCCVWCSTRRMFGWEMGGRWGRSNVVPCACAMWYHVHVNYWRWSGWRRREGRCALQGMNGFGRWQVAPSWLFTYMARCAASFQRAHHVPCGVGIASGWWKHCWAALDGKGM